MPHVGRRSERMSRLALIKEDLDDYTANIDASSQKDFDAQILRQENMTKGVKNGVEKAINDYLKTGDISKRCTF